MPDEFPGKPTNYYRRATREEIQALKKERGHLGKDSLISSEPEQIFGIYDGSATFGDFVLPVGADLS